MQQVQRSHCSSSAGGLPNISGEVRIMATTLIPSVICAALLSGLGDQALQMREPYIMNMIAPTLKGLAGMTIVASLFSAYKQLQAQSSAGLQGREVTYIRIPKAEYDALKAELKCQKELVTLKEATIAQLKEQLKP